MSRPLPAVSLGNGSAEMRRWCRGLPLMEQVVERIGRSVRVFIV
jgi:hypothetical protein